jgi:hypothetical protein
LHKSNDDFTATVDAKPSAGKERPDVKFLVLFHDGRFTIVDGQSNPGEESASKPGSTQRRLPDPEMETNPVDN